jgi:hypothetical protein
MRKTRIVYYLKIANIYNITFKCLVLWKLTKIQQR